jgi:GMP synthase-like glutamine amidotransferase
VSPAPFLLLQHAGFEGPGRIATAAKEAHVPLEVSRMDLDQPVPALEGLGGVIAMGGPMNALDDEGHPRLAAERELLRETVEAGLPVLGVCLGAQLLAAALGADMRPASQPELGFGPVTLVRDDPVLGEAGSELPAFHWHEETFDLPDGAELLASTEACPHQAFRVGELAYGLQFHVEVDELLAADWEYHLPEGVSALGPEREQVEEAGEEVLRRFFRRSLGLP